MEIRNNGGWATFGGIKVYVLGMLDSKGNIDLLTCDLYCDYVFLYVYLLLCHLRKAFKTSVEISSLYFC